MEKKVLPLPAVAGVLREHYVEARLHTDKPIPGIDRIHELQRRFAESLANPIYVTVDPADEKRLERFEGALLPSEDESRFVQFLEHSLERARPKVVRR